MRRRLPLLLLGAASLLLRGAGGQMVHGTALPSWRPTYQMNKSTFLMTCNNSGSFNASFGARWGIVDYDWSNWKTGKDGWANTVPMDCEEKLVRQSAMTKAVDNDTKVFVYRNMVKALPWYSSVREKLVDPAYAGFFLHFDCNASSTDGLKGEGGCHVPKQGTMLYHDQEQTSHGKCSRTGMSECCGVPCGEYLFDHRNGSMLREWFIDTFVGGPHGIDNPAIDGFCESHAVLCILAFHT